MNTNTSLTDHVAPSDHTPHEITQGLTDMYNLGIDHAIELIKDLMTDKVEAVVLINALEKIKQ